MLQDWRLTSGLRLQGVAPVTLRAGRARHARPDGEVVMLAVRADGPGTSGKRATGSPNDRRHRAKLDLRPPALRQAPAAMSRASFVRLAAIWLAGVVAVLVIALVVRFFG